MTKVLSFSSPTLSSTAPIADQSARQAALDIRSSCIVEAPAGSGKTGLLMQRFLKLLAAGVTEPEQVLAITFTNKATAELRERVLAQLVQARQQTPLADNASSFDHETRALAAAVLARDTELHWEILTRPERLNIRTIDSVCAEIAGSLPLLSQSGGTNRPVKDSSPFYRIAAQRTLMQLGGSDLRLHAALHTVMLHRDASFLDCETLIARMLARREQWGELVPLGSEFHDDMELDRVVRPRLERALEKIVCDGLSRAASLMPLGMLQQLAALAAQFGFNPGYNGKTSPIAFCAELQAAPEIAGDHLEHWKALVHLLLTASKDDWRGTFNVNHVGFEMSKAEKAALKSIIDRIKSPELLQAVANIRNLPPARYPDEQWLVARSLFHILRHALAELKVLFAERGECDFTEVALAARTALSHEFAAPPGAEANATDLALSAGSRLHHLLVDEMQDTSAAQYDLIQQLTRSWDGSSQTLFLVGDPKQSIYLFRQARVERFLRTMREERLCEIKLRRLHLTANFRSQSALVDGFNHTFDLLFSAPQTTTAADVPFVAATAVRGVTEPNAMGWHPAILSLNDSSQQYEQRQAITIRETIQSWIARPLPPGRTQPWRIAILARARNHFAAIVAELKRGNIAFRAVDIDPLDQCREVLDALALTRALLHPADRAAWLAVLHAPWCGLSLADLLMLTGEGTLETQNSALAAHTPISLLVDERCHLLSADGQAQLVRVWPTLTAALSTLGVSPLSTHVERTWRSLGADALLNEPQRTNVLRFLSLLHEMEPAIDLALLESRLKQLFAEPAVGSPAVDLLTIHKAKGLEWDFVLVPSLHRSVPRNSSDLLNWLELDQPNPTEESAAIILAPIQSKGEDSTLLNKWLNRVKESRERAEEKRLFYVACTRAREELHLFAACKQNAQGELTPPASGTLLKACWPAAEEHFRALQAASPATVIPMLQPVVDPQDEPLAIAAGAEQLPPPILQRLPLTFDPLARFNISPTDRLPYPAAATLPHAPAFDRPEGSFAVRAFGNVVHRFLQLLATRLESGTTADALLAELAQWQPRLVTVLRAEGLTPTTARRDAARALQALQQSLADPEGRWLLSPHVSCTTEQALTSARLQNLRADRTFFAGPAPLTEGASIHWIVDFKTATDHSRSAEDFETVELAKYRAQLEIYARIRRDLLPPGTPIRLALYYPLIPRLIHWESHSG